MSEVVEQVINADNVNENENLLSNGTTNGHENENGVQENGVDIHQQTTEDGQNGDNSDDKVNGKNGVTKYDVDKLEPEHFRKVFVGSLNYITTEDALRTHFSKYGEVIDSVIMKEAKTNKSRGFGFVTYSKSNMVDELMKNRPHKIDGRELETKRATPREDSGKPGAESTTKKLFVGAIKEGLTEDSLREYFGKYGKIEDCVIMREKDSNKLRGFGFVTFDDYDPVDKIVLEKFHVVNNQSVAVKKALPKDQTNQSSGGSSGHPHQGSLAKKLQNSKMGQNNRNNNSRNNRNNINNNDNFNNGSYSNNFGNGTGSNFNGNGYGGSYSNGSNFNSGNMGGMSNMNLNNFALLAQKMFEAATGNMQAPFSNGNGNGNGFNSSNQFQPINLMDNFNNNRRMDGPNRPVNFASDDFDGKIFRIFLHC